MSEGNENFPLAAYPSRGLLINILSHNDFEEADDIASKIISQ